ncbi:hypothetical protein Tco_0766447 [Tanacetum coccineum]
MRKRGEGKGGGREGGREKKERGEREDARGEKGEKEKKGREKNGGGEVQAQIRRIFLDGYGVLGCQNSNLHISSLSSRMLEFTTATAVACQAMWLREFLVKVTSCVSSNVAKGVLGESDEVGKTKMIIRFDNKSTIALSKNPVFHGRSKHIHTRYHFIRECVENEQVIVEHVSGENQRADPLTKALARIRFKEMMSLLGVQELPSSTQKCRG